ncbi:MAG: hypothetical protein LBQ61_02370 [Spirochaetales bacterium]|jgi:hypothetical protein|nr:hypothetical protein [Spirochaetales bacterium]
MRTCTLEKNKSHCPCSFGCGKAGICCECLDYHRSLGELPGCYFPPEVEKTGDRSAARFIEVVRKQGTAYLR